jgi:hypothetical protein
MPPLHPAKDTTRPYYIATYCEVVSSGLDWDLVGPPTRLRTLYVACKAFHGITVQTHHLAVRRRIALDFANLSACSEFLTRALVAFYKR